MNDKAAIGVFDSGVGGLTVLREARRALPNENFIYVGDAARAPYGSRRPEEIVAFMGQILRFFARRNVKLAIFACNTMTAYGYERAKDAYPFPLVPMDSAVQEALASSPHKKIGVIATQATVRNQMHSRAAHRIDPAADVYARACPAFVPLIEEGVIAGARIEEAARESMQFFQGTDIEALILGCTHYPLIWDVIQKCVGERVKLIDPARPTAAGAAALLRQRGLLHTGRGGGLEICFSKDLARARAMVKLVLNPREAKFKQVDFAAY